MSFSSLAGPPIQTIQIEQANDIKIPQLEQEQETPMKKKVKNSDTVENIGP